MANISKALQEDLGTQDNAWREAIRDICRSRYGFTRQPTATTTNPLMPSHAPMPPGWHILQSNDILSIGDMFCSQGALGWQYILENWRGSRADPRRFRSGETLTFIRVGRGGLVHTRNVGERTFISDDPDIPDNYTPSIIPDKKPMVKINGRPVRKITI